MKVLVACNTLTSIAQPAYTDHKNLLFAMARRHPDIEFVQMDARRLSIDRFRNQAAMIARRAALDYIFFIDDDMLLPPDTFTKLYEAQYDIIAAFNYIRGYPFKIMSFKYDLRCQTRRLVNVTDEDLPSSLGEVINVDAIGTAVCLIKTTVFDGVQQPYFLTGTHGTEDIYMCLKCKETNPDIKIGMHTGVITGHLLDPEVISYHTRKALMHYHESFMSVGELEAAKARDPEVVKVPAIRIPGYRKDLTYEELMAREMSDA